MSDIELPAEAVDKASALLESDHQELRLMLARASEANGWDEPGMKAYDNYPAKT